jgi:catechol 2,3-dioxygenase-like lactoylglutathione lyase family enzyme
MKHATLFLAALLFCVSCPAQENPKRPPILGIGSISIVLLEDPVGFYTKQLKLSPAGVLCGGGCISHIDVNSHQRIELMNRMQLDPVTLKPIQNNLAQVTFETADIEMLHRYLESRGIHASEILSLDPDGENPQFSLADPDGHRIGFIQFKGKDRYRRSEGQVSGHLIHAGFVVHDRAAEDRFYKDILGFRLYWQGGSKDDQIDWVDMQVPDGTDWIEYMLNVPNDADHRVMGVENHLALGVPDIRATQKQLLLNGVTLTEEPRIGRDGKWQLNLYDPDDTRVEFMEFKPVQIPCCSQFAGPHPGPKQ